MAAQHGARLVLRQHNGWSGVARCAHGEPSRSRRSVEEGAEVGGDLLEVEGAGQGHPVEPRPLLHHRPAAGRSLGQENPARNQCVQNEV